jgi:hypothetical protein
MVEGSFQWGSEELASGSELSSWSREWRENGRLMRSASVPHRGVVAMGAMVLVHHASKYSRITPCSSVVRWTTADFTYDTPLRYFLPFSATGRSCGNCSAFIFRAPITKEHFHAYSTNCHSPSTTVTISQSTERGVVLGTEVALLEFGEERSRLSC